MIQRFLALALVVCPISWIEAEPLMPAATGTTWNYEMTQVKPLTGDLDLEENTVQKERFDVSYRMAGPETLANMEYQKLEMYRDNVRTSTDLIREEANGIVCSARRDGNGKLLNFDPPQTLVAAPLKVGAKWDFDGKIGATAVTQHYETIGFEQVEVPAGKFPAWWIHCDQTLPTKAAIDRWFVPGTGFIKIRTQIKNDDGEAIQETLLELKQAPRVAVAATPTPAAAPAASVLPRHLDKLTVSVGKDPAGEAVKEFNVLSPAIYARWYGHGLPDKANVRAVFVAEKVPDLAADFEIDDVEAVSPSANAHGVFTLAKPETNWTPGDYRVDFFVNDDLITSARFKVAK